MNKYPGYLRTDIAGLVAASAAVMFFQACGSSDSDGSATAPYTDDIPAIEAVVDETMVGEHLKALLLGITVGGESLLMMHPGESMTGIPATIDMHYRNGNIAVGYRGYLLYRLFDEGIIDPGDSLGKWLPEYPNAENVTLEMLISNLACYPDCVPQDAFQTQFEQDPFHQWKPQELTGLAFEYGTVCMPAEQWRYAHTNFVILGLVLEKAAGKPLDELMQTYVLSPLGLNETAAPNTPYIPNPVLHSFSTDRGIYEDATFWNPSWTLPEGAVQYTTIGDTLAGFRAIGRGEGLSPESHRAMLAPKTVGLFIWTDDLYYAQGVVYNNGWIVQNPQFAGLYGIAAYNADKDIALAIWCTKTSENNTTDNTAVAIAKQISVLLTPEHPIR